jgi:hypothetical protein
MEVVINGRNRLTDDWSPAGFRVEVPVKDLVLGQSVNLDIIVTYERTTLRQVCKGEVVRTVPHGAIAFKITDLDEMELELLGRLHETLSDGQASPGDDG